MRMSLTQAAVADLSVKPVRYVVYDTRVVGLAVKVYPSGRKTFIVYQREARLSPNPITITLGRCDRLTVDTARARAKEAINQLAAGIHPGHKSRDSKTSTVSLSEVFEAYLKDRKLKTSTKADYRRVFEETFKDWKTRELADITEQDVVQKHRKRSQTSPARADYAMRVLRALFHYAKHSYRLSDGSVAFPNNPVEALSHGRAWNRVKRRQRVLKAVDLPAWVEAVLRLEAEYPGRYATHAQSYFLLMLFTGLRSTELARLAWRSGVRHASGHYDARDGVIHLRDTKSGYAADIPISTHAKEVLKRMEGLSSRWVYPKTTADTPLDYTTLRKALEWVNRRANVSVSRHDLRRTFLTAGDELDISAYTLKRLVGHRPEVGGRDVTAGYIVPDSDRVRRAAQLISDALMAAATATKSDTPPPPEHQTPS